MALANAGEPRARQVLGVFLLQPVDFLSNEEGEVFQVADDITVVRVDPKTGKTIDARALRIEPDGASFSLAELGAVALVMKRLGEAEGVASEFFRARSMPA